MWQWEYANRETIYYGTITEYWFRTKKGFANKSCHTITMFLKLVTEEKLKLPNFYTEHITGQNYVMKSKDTSKTATGAKGQNQTDTQPMVNYNPRKYQRNCGNL